MTCGHGSASPRTLWISSRTCNPISRNTTFSSRNCTVRQLMFSAMRERADCSARRLVPEQQPGDDDGEHARTP